LIWWSREMRVLRLLWVPFGKFAVEAHESLIFQLGSDNRATQLESARWWDTFVGLRSEPSCAIARFVCVERDERRW
jgi:hypothetical protein